MTTKPQPKRRRVDEENDTNGSQSRNHPRQQTHNSPSSPAPAPTSTSTTAPTSNSSSSVCSTTPTSTSTSASTCTSTSTPIPTATNARENPPEVGVAADGSNPTQSGHNTDQQHQNTGTAAAQRPQPQPQPQPQQQLHCITTACTTTTPTPAPSESDNVDERDGGGATTTTRCISSAPVGSGTGTPGGPISQNPERPPSPHTYSVSTTIPVGATNPVSAANPAPYTNSYGSDDITRHYTYSASVTNSSDDSAPRTPGRHETDGRYTNHGGAQTPMNDLEVDDSDVNANASSVSPPQFPCFETEVNYGNGYTLCTLTYMFTTPTAQPTGQAATPGPQPPPAPGAAVMIVPPPVNNPLAPLAGLLHALELSFVQFYLLILDENGKAVSANHFVEAAIGIPAAVIKQEVWSETYVEGADRPLVWEVQANLIAGMTDPTSRSVVWHILAPTGHTVRVHWVNAIVVDSLGNFLASVSVGHTVVDDSCQAGQCLLAAQVANCADGIASDLQSHLLGSITTTATDYGADS
ncbi:hypothetical protein Pelo_11457 [Pelomyxa schiedti]|nr:hypothetical protein Pelo_11457 [Pelomyxa schiedti]